MLSFDLYVHSRFLHRPTVDAPRDAQEAVLARYQRLEDRRARRRSDGPDRSGRTARVSAP